MKSQSFNLTAARVKITISCQSDELQTIDTNVSSSEPIANSKQEKRAMRNVLISSRQF
jgi:hypothetical protein